MRAPNPMPGWPWMLCLALACVPPATAQTVPDVEDVYASGPTERFEPPPSPDALVRELRAFLGERRFIELDFALSTRRGMEATGTLTLDIPVDDRPLRYRMNLRGQTADASAILATLGSDGRRHFQVDLLEESLTTGNAPEQLGPLGRLAGRLLGLPFAGATDLPTRAVGEVTVGEPCYLFLVSDPQRREHLYLAVSEHDALPRRIERIFDDTASGVEVLTFEVTRWDLRPSLPPRPFQPRVPEGYSRREAVGPGVP